jgi:hypothetical protein
VAAALTNFARSAEYFAAPHARPFARGTRSDPFDLAAALSAPQTIRPGDTLWLLEGVYRGHFTSRLRGTEGKPVTIRQLPGQRVTIESYSDQGKNPLFMVEGDWCVFWGLEFTCRDPARVSRESGPWPGDINRGGIFCRAGHVKFINLFVHDVNNGFGFWSDGEGGEIYGCIICNNGFQGTDRGWGHGIYAQNRRGTKRLVDNIVFNQFGYGIHCYGSKNAFLNNFEIDGNISFNNGSLSSPEQRAPNIAVGGACPAERISITNNVAYSNLATSGIRIGYSRGRPNADVIVKDNYVVGEVSVTGFSNVTFTGNTLFGKDTVARLWMNSKQNLAAYKWDRNVYLRYNKRYSPFTLAIGDEGDGVSFAEWKTQTGNDTHSQFAQARPDGVKVFVRPNRYEPGRGNIAVLNWDRRPEVELDLSGVLRDGQPFRIVSAQDFYGEVIVRGSYHNQPVRLPMKPVPAQRPIGPHSLQLPLTEPEFGVFVVLPE